MIARIKATGRFIDVIPYGDEYAQLFHEGDFKVYTKDELDFRVDIDWRHYRIQAAMYAMQGLISCGIYSQPSTIRLAQNRGQSGVEFIAQMATEFADALIAELQKKNNND